MENMLKLLSTGDRITAINCYNLRLVSSVTAK